MEFDHDKKYMLQTFEQRWAHTRISADKYLHDLPILSSSFLCMLLAQSRAYLLAAHTTQALWQLCLEWEGNTADLEGDGDDEKDRRGGSAGGRGRGRGGRGSSRGGRARR
jgi:hypothetical protein